MMFSRRFSSVAFTGLVISTLLSVVVVQAEDHHASHTHGFRFLKSKDDYLVVGLEEIEPAFSEFEGDMYAGRIPVDVNNNKTRGEFQFWLFAPHHPSVSDSLMLWFNGGPGCSSISAGLLFEHSPVTVQPRPAGYCCTGPDLPLQVNKYSWTQTTYMLYVEQPAGTGFSTGVDPQTELDVARDMVDWLTNFYRIFDELVDYDLFVFGESYAGMYVPSVAHGIHQENIKRRQKNGYHYDTDINNNQIRLKGIGIGNGVIDVKTQGPAVIDWGYWHGVIDMATRDYLHRNWEQCYQSAVAGNGMEQQPEPFHSFTTGDECGFLDAVLMSAGDSLLEDMAPNMYDAMTWDKYPILSDGPNSTIWSFYNNPKVQKLIHAAPQNNTTWHMCQVGDRPFGLKMLDHDRPITMLPYLAELMDEADVEVLIYNGDTDISVNAQGTEKALNRMDWSQANDWYNANRTLWINNDNKGDDPLSPAIAGYVKEVGRLHFVTVRNSGHMVPYNVPANGLDLITRFLSGRKTTTLGDVVLPNYPMQYGGSGGGGATHQPDDEFRTSGRGSWRHRHGGSLFGILIGNVMVGVAAFLGGFAVASKWSRRKGYEPVMNSAF